MSALIPASRRGRAVAATSAVVAAALVLYRRAELQRQAAAAR